MKLVIERGTGRTNADAFATVVEARRWAKTEWGFEVIAGTADNTPDDLELALALKASAKFMSRLPWVGVKRRRDQALAWPRYMYEPEDYYRSKHLYGKFSGSWFGFGLETYAIKRWWASHTEVPPEIVEANIRLARDVLDGLVDPTGRGRPVKASSVSGDGGSVRFAKPQVLYQGAKGLEVRAKDQFYAIRHLVSPWLKPRSPHARLRRG